MAIGEVPRGGAHAVDHSLGGGGKAQMAKKRDPLGDGGSEQTAWCLQRARFVVSVEGQTRTALFATLKPSPPNIETRSSDKLDESYLK